MGLRRSVFFAVIITTLGGLRVHGQNLQGSITCTISTKRTVYKIGETPEINVQIENLSGDTILLPKALDGSDAQWRYPHAYYEIRKRRSPFYRLHRVFRCGNMDGFPKTHVVKLAPGESFNPEADNFYATDRISDTKNFRHKGTYRIRYFYSTNNTNPGDWFGDSMVYALLADDKEAISKYQTRLDSLTKVDLVSNKIKIRIR